ncbi:MAG: hypothetical protein CL923_09265 [Deltaproteobacteria bacterium]|nr:hypothetical protein [Deltaproteobacteria bacterium]
MGWAPWVSRSCAQTNNATKTLRLLQDIRGRSNRGASQRETFTQSLRCVLLRRVNTIHATQTKDRKWNPPFSSTPMMLRSSAPMFLLMMTSFSRLQPILEATAFRREWFTFMLLISLHYSKRR